MYVYNIQIEKYIDLDCQGEIRVLSIERQVRFKYYEELVVWQSGMFLQIQVCEYVCIYKYLIFIQVFGGIGMIDVVEMKKI